MSILRVLLLAAVLPCFCAARPSSDVSPQSAKGAPPGAYEAVPASPGERCIVCGMPLHPGDMDLIVKGRRVPLDTLHVQEFLRHQEKYFATLQPRAALFQEPYETPGTTAQGGISAGWFLVGLSILVALLFGGLTAYAAITRGLNPAPYFFLGLILPLFGLLFVMTRPGQASARQVPKGFVKVPRTSPPAACPRCGAFNHPAARRCATCGSELRPAASSEASRAL